MSHDTNGFHIHRSKGTRASLTKDDEQRLFAAIHAGDEGARRHLIEAHIGFVVTVAKEYAQNDEQLDDYIQEGFVGMLRAIETFEPERGHKFISYAVWWVRQRIMALVLNYREVVDYPASVKRSKSQIDRILASHPHLSAEERKQARGKLKFRTSHSYVRLDRALDADQDNGCLHGTLTDDDAPCPEEHVIRGQLAQIIARAASILSQRERYVVLGYYGIGRPPMNLSQIGDALNLSRERIRQIRDKALDKIKASLQKTYSSDELYELCEEHI